MSTLDRRRFRVEIAAGAGCLALLALTAAWPDWIEALSGVEPDGGSGLLEWTLVALFAVSAIGLPWHGMRGLRRVAATAVTSERR